MISSRMILLLPTPTFRVLLQKKKPCPVQLVSPMEKFTTETFEIS